MELGKDYKLREVCDAERAESFGFIPGIMGKNIKEVQNGLMSSEKTNKHYEHKMRLITKMTVLKECKKSLIGKLLV